MLIQNTRLHAPQFGATNKISFWESEKAHGYFSNFSNHAFRLNGQQWRTGPAACRRVMPSTYGPSGPFFCLTMAPARRCAGFRLSPPQQVYQGRGFKKLGAGQVAPPKLC